MKIDELRNKLLKAKQAYYFGGTPIMSDAEYDALEAELKRINPKDPIFSTVGAPVPPDNILSKAKHSMPMGSQNKVNSAEEFIEWYKKYAKNGKIHVTLKADGGSAAAYYKNGNLIHVITRGDGFIGEDVTSNGFKFKGLPVFIDGFNGSVRMEVVLPVKDWKILDKTQESNPRNIGNGIMGRKDGSDSDILTILAFDITDDDINFNTETEKYIHLKKLGFNVVPGQTCHDEKEVVKLFENIAKKRQSLDFWIDGVVLKIDDLNVQDALGVTGGCPKGQVAWKFENEGAVTTLNDIEITIGHTGALIPNGRLKPVRIGGTTISNVSLVNWEEIKRLDIAINDTVFVVKANDIIPKIIKVIDRPKNRKEIPEPTKCPFCGGKVERKENTVGGKGAVTMCTNEDCEKQSIGKIKKWVKNLDIQGIGDSVLEAIVEAFKFEDPSDIYRLGKDISIEELAAISVNSEKDIRLGKKRATSIVEEIEKKKSLTLADFLGSLGINGLGRRRVELMITAADGELDKLEDWMDKKLSSDEFAAKVGVPNLGASIQNDINKKKDIINQLLKNGVTIMKTKKVDSSNVITFCITGKLESGRTKEEYGEMLKEVGYKLEDSVSKNLNYLVTADPNGNSGKTQKAKKYGVKIITEDELIEMIEEKQ
jgi:DNA ligase (NAD+)